MMVVASLDIAPNYDGENIELTFLTVPETEADNTLFSFKLSPDEARLLSRLLIVAAETEGDDSFQMNVVRVEVR